MVADRKKKKKKKLIIDNLLCENKDTSITHIPTIMLEKTIGDNMIRLLEKGEDVVLSIKFPTPDQ